MFRILVESLLIFGSVQVILEVTWLANSFNKILNTKKMPYKWRKSIIGLIYKKKVIFKIIQTIMVLNSWSHTMKLWKKVIEHKLKFDLKIFKIQFGFKLGRLLIKPIFLLQMLMEKYSEETKSLYGFYWFTNVSNKVPGEVLLIVLISFWSQ